MHDPSGFPRNGVNTCISQIQPRGMLHHPTVKHGANGDDRKYWQNELNSAAAISCFGSHQLRDHLSHCVAATSEIAATLRKQALALKVITPRIRSRYCTEKDRC